MHCLDTNYSSNHIILKLYFPNFGKDLKIHIRTIINLNLESNILNYIYSFNIN